VLGQVRIIKLKIIMKNLKFAQDLIKASPSTCAGFNQFINGGSEPKKADYGNVGQWYLETQGFEYAKKMAKEDGIAFTYVFKCEKSDCFPFSYGGTFVCDSCNKSNVQKEWWKIQVEKDGNEFCCHGLDFINLQESENYAFGNTFENAIENYCSLMSKM
jgi:hypothetical protein